VGGCDAHKPPATSPDDAGVTAPLDAAAGAHDAGSPPASGSADAGVRIGCRLEDVGRAPDGDLAIGVHIDPPISPTEEFLRLSVTEKAFGDNNPFHTAVGLGGTIQFPTDFFALAILMAKGWDVATQPGDVILYYPWNRVSDCPGPHEFSDEVVSDVILDEAGELLLLSAATVALAPDGAIVFGVDLATALGIDGEPAFGLRWIDVGCPPLAENAQLPDGSRSVAIEVFDSSDPMRSVAVLPGERGEIVLGGRTYVLAAAAAFSPTGDTYCGFALFSLYEKGYVISP
jgi:hypothetical protein